MQTTERLGRNRPDHDPERDRLDHHVGEQVLRALGRPPGLIAVQVRFLWEGSYRVNVIVGSDVVTARIAHSYFVTIGPDDAVSTYAPPISKLYGLPDLR